MKVVHYYWYPFKINMKIRGDIIQPISSGFLRHSLSATLNTRSLNTLFKTYIWGPHIKPPWSQLELRINLIWSIRVRNLLRIILQSQTNISIILKNTLFIAFCTIRLELSSRNISKCRRMQYYIAVTFTVSFLFSFLLYYNCYFSAYLEINQACQPSPHLPLLLLLLLPLLHSLWGRSPGSRSLQCPLSRSLQWASLHSWHSSPVTSASGQYSAAGQQQDWLIAVSAAGLADCCQFSRTGWLLSVQQDWLIAVSAAGLVYCCQFSRTGWLLSVQQDWLIAGSAAGLANCCQCSRNGWLLSVQQDSWLLSVQQDWLIAVLWLIAVMWGTAGPVLDQECSDCWTRSTGPNNINK